MQHEGPQNMLKPLVVALALSVPAFIPQAASAANVSVTYSGVITSLNADDSIFGGHASAGDPISAEFFYTTSVPGTRTLTPGLSDELSGGLGFGTDPVISKAIFTSGAYAFSFLPDVYNDIYTSASYLDAYAYDIAGNAAQTYILPDRMGPLNLESSFSSTGVGDSGGAATQYSFVSDGTSTVDFDATRVVVSAAPEPASWLLMLMGVGGLGLALTRRSRDQEGWAEARSHT